MQKSLDLGVSDAAAKRAGKLSPRAAMMIGAAAASLVGTPIDRHYKGYTGFAIEFRVAKTAFKTVRYVWIGNGGGCRRTNTSRDGSPRRFHARPDLAAKLEALGRKLVAKMDINPALYRDLLPLDNGRLRNVGDGTASIRLRERLWSLQMTEEALARKTAAA